VPVEAALAAAGPEDVVHVLDCALAPVTGTPGACAALPAAEDACGLGIPAGPWLAPTESRRGALDVVLRAFTVARAVANRTSTLPHLRDPRVRVAPHVADAWATGLLTRLPEGPRDFRRTGDLVAAGRAATAQWLDAGAPRAATHEPAAES